MSVRRSIMVLRRAVVASALLLAIGCGEAHSPGDDDEDHAAHVIPAHKPRSFPEAVDLLEAWNARFATAVDPADATIAAEIARWLPELAADADMPERPWDEIDARSVPLATCYERLKGGDRGEPLNAARAIVAELRMIRDEADPRWFDAGGPTTREPSPTTEPSP